MLSRKFRALNVPKHLKTFVSDQAPTGFSLDNSRRQLMSTNRNAEHYRLVSEPPFLTLVLSIKAVSRECFLEVDVVAPTIINSGIDQGRRNKSQEGPANIRKLGIGKGHGWKRMHTRSHHELYCLCGISPGSYCGF
jgi:hypothetical protein